MDPIRYTIVSRNMVEPVDVLAAAYYSRADPEDAGDFMEIMLPAARAMVEEHTKRALMTTTIRASMDSFPGCRDRSRALNGSAESTYAQGRHSGHMERAIYLPLPPMVSVTSVQYVDETGATQTLAPEKYIVDTVAEPGRIVPAYGADWPAARYQPNAVQITYVAGYAPQCTPPQLKLAICMLANYWLNNPEAAGSKIEEQPLAVRTLIASHSVPQIG